MPRLSRSASFWALAVSFLVVAAFSTAPSSLYGLYEQRDHLSSLTITFVYAVYAVGVVGSLLLTGHVSDWYGRRVVLLPAITVAIVAAALFLVWRSLPGLFVARVLTGVAVGATVASATAFLTDLDAGPAGLPTRRAGIVSTIANIGGLAPGPLIAGVLATTNWRAHRLIAAGIAPALIGLGLLVSSAWTSPPSLALFLIGGIVSGAGGGAIFRGSLSLVISAAPVLVRPADVRSPP